MSERLRAFDGHHINFSQNSTDTHNGVLFLHGVTRNWRSFYPLLGELNSECKLTAIDFRGHGHSERTSGSYLVTDYVEDVLAVLESSFVPHQYIYGHSLGAMVALSAAARTNKKIKGIILEDPPFSTMGPQIKGSQLHRFFIGLSELSNSKINSQELFDKFSNIPLHKEGDQQTLLVKDLRDELSRWFAAESLMKIDYEIIEPIINGEWLIGYNFEELAKNVDCPVLLLQADESAGGMLKDADVKLLKRNIKEEISHHFFSGAGHILHTNKTNQILKLLREKINE